MDYLVELQKYIDLPFLIVFMFLAYGLKNFITAALTALFDKRIDKSFTIFLIGTIVAVPFWSLFESDKLKLMITWATGIALHEVAFKYIEDKIKGKKP